jgi:hypothetical protein
MFRRKAWEANISDDESSTEAVARELYEAVLTASEVDAVFRALARIGPHPDRASDVLLSLERRLEALGVLVERFGFAVDAIRAANGGTSIGPRSAAGPNAVRSRGATTPTSRSSTLNTLVQDVIGGGASQAVERSQSQPTPRELLVTLPDVKEIPHVAERLKIATPGVTKLPRRASRGNALLFVLDRFGRTRPLTLGDLVFALQKMRAIEVDLPAADAQRITAWEVNELRRRGWPVEKVPGEGYRLEDGGDMT